MVVAGTISLIIIISLIVPGPYLKRYYIFAAIVMGSLYFFAKPLSSDCYRLYQMRDAMKNISWETLLAMKEKEYGNEQLNIYIPHYPLFAAYTKIVSYLPRPLFMVIPCTMMYMVPLRFCFDRNLYDPRKWVYVLSYTYYLFATDYISTAAIRNISVGTLFCLFLYEEIIHKANKVICFIGYVLLLFIHSYASLLILTRILTLICEFGGKRMKALLLLATVSGYTLLTSPIINMTLGRISIFSYVINKLTEYSVYTGTAVNTRRYFMLLIYILIVVLCFLCEKYIICRMDRHEQKIYGEWLTFLQLEIAYTVGSFSQYDTFVRGSFFILPSFGILLRRCIPMIGDIRFGDIHFRTYEQRIIHTFIYVGGMGMAVVLIAYFTWIGYVWMDNWFQLG